jgi:hypothetical protein
MTVFSSHPLFIYWYDYRLYSEVLLFQVTGIIAEEHVLEYFRNPLILGRIYC